MRREHFYRNKKALKRSAAGAVLALFLALQITGCSQTADQDKAAQKTEQAQGTEKEGAGAEKASQGAKLTAPARCGAAMKGEASPRPFPLHQ